MFNIDNFKEEECLICNENFLFIENKSDYALIKCNCTSYIYDMYKAEAERLVVYDSILEKRYDFYEVGFYINHKWTSYPDEIENILEKNEFKSINDLRYFLLQFIEYQIFL